MTYPWHLKQWGQLLLAAEQDRLAHALLLSGAEGSGIKQFALEFSRYLLCRAPGHVGAACEQCRSCLLHKAGNHPDVRLIDPDAAGAQIKVEAVRDLITYLQLSSQYGRRKIAIIEPAEGMNRHSANSLLKTLEEPATSALLMLIAYQPARLPVTLRSRCQNISFNRIDRHAASAWLNERIDEPARTEELLELSGGAPLTALDLAETDTLQQWEELLTDLQDACHPHTYPVKIAEKWLKHEVVEVLHRLLFMFSKMAVLRAAGATQSGTPSALDDKLRSMAAELQLPALLDCHALTLQNYRLLTGGSNLNKQSLLEQIIVYWQSIHR